MTKEERKEKEKFRQDLIDLLLSNTPNDTSYYKRLIWANSIIANALNYFEEVTTNIE